MTSADGDAVALTHDGTLILRGSAAARLLCRAWIPLGRRPACARPAAATLTVRVAGPSDRREAANDSTFVLGGVAVRVEGERATVSGGASGELRLDDALAELALPAGDDALDALFRRSALTAASALLLGRLGRALVHGGAVVHPDTGAAWLLVGDSHAGKSTTVANLARAGWGVLADDTLSLSSSGDTVLAEGWPRMMHLDAGWGTSAPAGRRVERDPLDVLSSAFRQTPTPVGGLLFPKVVAAQPTSASRKSGADALTLLIRQSPWLFADRAMAPSTLGLLRRSALMPTAALSLGSDSFADPGRLDAAVRAATG